MPSSHNSACHPNWQMTRVVLFKPQIHRELGKNLKHTFPYSKSHRTKWDLLLNKYAEDCALNCAFQPARARMCPKVPYIF